MRGGAWDRRTPKRALRTGSRPGPALKQGPAWSGEGLGGARSKSITLARRNQLVHHWDK
jgi:hypothetical protein